MELDEDIIENVKREIGQIKTEKAEKLVEENRVKILGIDLGWDYKTFTISAEIMEKSTKTEFVYIRLDLEKPGTVYSHNCSCKPYSYRECEHILAVLLAFKQNPKYINMIKETIEKERKEQEKRALKHIIENFKNSTMDREIVHIGNEDIPTILNSNINLVPVLKQNRYGEYELSFKIGENKMYKIKSLEDFYINYSNKNIYKYGENLVFKHTEENFAYGSQEYLQFILKYGQAIHYGNIALENKNSYNVQRVPSSNLLLKGEVLEDFFNIIKDKYKVIEIDGKKANLKFKKTEESEIFNLEAVNENEYKLSIKKENLKVLEGTRAIYTISDENVYEYDKEKYTSAFKLFQEFAMMGKTDLTFEEDGLLNFVNNVLPKVRDNVSLSSLSEDIKKQYIPKKLGVKVYLDVTAKGDVLATIKFCYDEIEFEPFTNKPPQIPRDRIAESQVLNKLMYDGFTYDRNYESYILKEEEKIYNFITNCINYYMENYEVLISEEFKKKEIRQPKISALGVRIQNNLLNIDLSGLDFDVSELQNILQKYKLKKKYYRLKNGDFLSLEQNEDLDFIENLTEGMDIDYKTISKGKIKIPVNRSLYLNKLLDNVKNIEITQDKQFKEIITNAESSKIDEEISIPEELEATLRTYQKTGYKWLKVLDKYKFGGILADDMGLRKNIANNSNHIRK